MWWRTWEEAQQHATAVAVMQSISVPNVGNCTGAHETGRGGLTLPATATPCPNVTKRDCGNDRGRTDNSDSDRKLNICIVDCCGLHLDHVRCTPSCPPNWLNSALTCSGFRVLERSAVSSSEVLIVVMPGVLHMPGMIQRASYTCCCGTNPKLCLDRHVMPSCQHTRPGKSRDTHYNICAHAYTS